MNDRIQVFKPDGTFVKEVIHRRRARWAPARPGTSPSRRTRSRSTSIWPTARTTACTSSLRDTLEVLTSFGEGGRQPGEFYGRAQHRHRFQRQHLHDRDLSRPARAEVRLQGDRHCDVGSPGRALAQSRQIARSENHQRPVRRSFHPASRPHVSRTFFSDPLWFRSRRESLSQEPCCVVSACRAGAKPR